MLLGVLWIGRGDMLSRRGGGKGNGIVLRIRCVVDMEDFKGENGRGQMRCMRRRLYAGCWERWGKSIVLKGIAWI